MDRAGRGRTGRAPAILRALAGTAGLALLAACGSPGGSAGGEAEAGAALAVVVPGADCLAPEVLDELGLRLDPSLAEAASHDTTAEPGAVPDDFEPTGVLTCEVGGRMLDGAGTWTAVTATTREGTAAQTAALVAALAAPPPTVGTPAAAECASRPAFDLWLLDAMDRAVRPNVPRDACGAPAPGVRAALAALAVTGVVDRPVELVGPSPDAS